MTQTQSSIAMSSEVQASADSKAVPWVRTPRPGDIRNDQYQPINQPPSVQTPPWSSFPKINRTLLDADSVLPSPSAILQGDNAPRLSIDSQRHYLPGFVSSPQALSSNLNRARQGTNGGLNSPYLPSFQASPRVASMDTTIKRTIKPRSESFSRLIDPRPRSQSETVMDIPYLNKIQLLSRLCPSYMASVKAISKPGSASVGSSVDNDDGSKTRPRGGIVAIEGNDLAIVDEVSLWLENYLRQCPEYHCCLVNNYDSRGGQDLPDKSPAGIIHDTPAYLKEVTEWHERVASIKSFILGSASSLEIDLTTIDKDDYVQTAMKEHIVNLENKDLKQIPVVLIPRYTLGICDSSAINIPIVDRYNAIEHWQWMASVWRGGLGPDITIYIDSSSQERKNSNRLDPAVSSTHVQPVHTSPPDSIQTSIKSPTATLEGSHLSVNTNPVKIIPQLSTIILRVQSKHNVSPSNSCTSPIRSHPLTAQVTPVSDTSQTLTTPPSSSSNRSGTERSVSPPGPRQVVPTQHLRRLGFELDEILRELYYMPKESTAQPVNLSRKRTREDVLFEGGLEVHDQQRSDISTPVSHIEGSTLEAGVGEISLKEEGRESKRARDI
jgi:hypothetical protein